MIFFHSTGSVSTSFTKPPIPALLINISAVPNSLVNFSIACFTSSNEETSADAYATLTPKPSIFLATSFNASSVLASSPTFTPSFAKAKAIASPIPLPAPVTNATLPFNDCPIFSNSFEMIIYLHHNAEKWKTPINALYLVNLAKLHKLLYG